MTDLKQIEEAYQEAWKGSSNSNTIVTSLGELRKFASSIAVKLYIKEFLDACINIDNDQTIIIREGSVGLLFDPYDFH
jgi:hypothetical protein